MEWVQVTMSTILYLEPMGGGGESPGKGQARSPQLPGEKNRTQKSPSVLDSTENSPPFGNEEHALAGRWEFGFRIKDGFSLLEALLGATAPAQLSMKSAPK